MTRTAGLRCTSGDYDKSVHTRTLTRLIGERAWYPQISATRPSGRIASAERAQRDKITTPGQ